MVPLFKLKLFPTLILVTLMATLQSFHLILDRLVLVRSLLHNLRSNHRTLTEFILTWRWPTHPAIRRFKRSHYNTRMEIVIAKENNQRQVAIQAPPYSSTQAFNKSSKDWIVLSV